MKRIAKAIIAGFFLILFLFLSPAALAQQNVFERTDPRPIIITKDGGGPISVYFRAWTLIEQSQRPVIIDGICASACTLFLGILKREQICATERAVLAFHAGGKCVSDGVRCLEKPFYDETANNELMSLYPENIRAWFTSQGGLKPDMEQFLLLRGKELEQFVRRC